MKKISKILLSIALLSTSIHAADDPYQLKLTVKAHHNDTIRILDDNSVLFSKDAFQFTIQTSSPMYIYVFLIDSNNNIQLLEPPNTSAFVPKDGSILFPSNNTRDWYRCDTPSQHPKYGLSKCDYFFRQKSLKLLENTRFGELGDPVGVVFVRRNHLINYAATRDGYRCATGLPAPEN